jgi:hypothetical protein
MPDEMDAGRPGMARLPGFDEQSDRGQYRDRYGPYGPSVPASGYPQRDYARDRGVRSTRRTSTWTAAALIAAVAATTGYLAHSMPSTSAGTGYTTTKQSGHAGVVKHRAPGVSGPVVTSGGSGAVGAGRSGGGGAGGWSDN